MDQKGTRLNSKWIEASSKSIRKNAKFSSHNDIVKIKTISIVLAWTMALCTRRESTYNL